jgi:alginate O-acetyltransferase complex protein AlgI
MALYISVFPQLIAGPIIRYHEIASQFLSRRVTAEGFADGARRFVIGLGKKMLIANTVAVAADGAFSVPADRLTPGMAWLGVACYTLQIYYDFSGYSDMAIGLGRMFGFTFPENFNYPYVSASITEFWRRWHITLSNWFRDYLYIPLGGNRRGPLRTYANLLTVFFLCGLWHGASWTFVAWGLFHGTFLIVERLAARARGGATAGPAWRPFSHAYALAVVMVGWVFFRAESFGQANTFLRAMAGRLPASGWAGYEYDPRVYLNHETVLAIAAGVVGAMPVARGLRRLADRLADGTAAAPARPLTAALVACASVVVLASVFVASSAKLAAGTHNPFIYFRF